MSADISSVNQSGSSIMRFVFKEEQAFKAAWFLTTCADPKHKPSLEKLAQLLYIVDRRSLIETGFPLTGSQIVLGTNGPVLQEFMDFSTADWDKTFLNKVYNLKDAYSLDLLSNYFLRILQDTYDQFGNLDEKELATWMKGNCPEGQVPIGEVIDPAIILESEGMSEENIKYLKEEAEYYYQFS